MSEKPLVTVYMPTHNRSLLVGRAIESVLNQTYENIELIVVDDGSSDDTQEVLAEYDDPRLKVLVNSTAKGAPFSRNRAVNEAKGRYVTGLDDDDFFRPERISQMIEAISEDAAFVSSGYEVLSRKGSRFVYCSESWLGLGDILSSNLIGNQVLVRTDRLVAVGGFDETLPAWQDYDLWIRLVRMYGKGRRIESPSYVVDQTHPHERISTSPEKIKKAYERFLNKHFEYKKPFYRSALKASLLHYDIKNMTFVDFMSVVIGGRYKRAAGLASSWLMQKADWNA